MILSYTYNIPCEIQTVTTVTSLNVRIIMVVGAMVTVVLAVAVVIEVLVYVGIIVNKTAEVLVG